MMQETSRTNRFDLKQHVQATLENQIYLTEPFLAPRGHTHVHLAVLGSVGGGRRVVEVLL